MNGQPPAAAISTTRSWTTWLLGAGLVAATLVTFWPCVHNGFVLLDDPEYITGNPEIQHGLSWSVVRWSLTSFRAGNWHPLTWMVHAVDWQLWGARAYGHHLISVVLHAANALMLYAFLVRTTSARWRSAAVAALFALHPLRVESVAWASELKDVLSAFFGLLTLLGYAAYCRRPGWARYLLSLALFSLGLLAKPMLVTLPFLLGVLDAWPFGRTPGSLGTGTKERWGRLVLEKVPFLVIALASATATLRAQRSAGAVAAFHLQTPTWRLHQIALGYGRYLGKLLWPSKLCVLYPLRADTPVAGWLAVVALLGSLVIAWALRRRFPALTTGWFWFLGSLVPVIGVVRVGSQSIADRYTYLPTIGILIAVAFSFPALTDSRSKGWAAGACLLVVSKFATLSTRQISTWRDAETLDSHALAMEPENPVMADGLARIRESQGRLGEAEALFRFSVGRAPWLGASKAGLGAVLLREGKPEEALPLLQQAHRLDPPNGRIAFNLAGALVRVGRFAEAKVLLQAMLKAEPARAEVDELLGSILLREGNCVEAASAFQAALGVRPGSPSAKLGLESARHCPDHPVRLPGP